MQILLQISNEKKWYNKFEFQKNLTLLHSSHTWLVKNLEEQLNNFQPLQANIHEMEDMISECQQQLNEIDTSLSQCLKLKKVEYLQKYKEKIVVILFSSFT